MPVADLHAFRVPQKGLLCSAHTGALEAQDSVVA
jgi:hypothetical protein